jgi:ABC-type branched-subunit amino acid transport system permease subunit
MRKSFIAQNPSVLWFLAGLAIFTLGVTFMSEAAGVDMISTSFLKTLGKTLCLCLVAIAMDVVWGYCGILSLGHFAFFGIGGYAIGMWLMYARTEGIVATSLDSAALPPTPQEITDAIGSQIFGVVGSSDFPALWAFSHSLPLQLLAVVLAPGLLALVFGWLAFRSRVTGVYLSILTQAMTLALSLYFFQNDTGLRGNNGLSGLQNIPGLEARGQAVVSLWFFWASALALGMGLCFVRLCRVRQVRIGHPRDPRQRSPRAVFGLSCRTLQTVHLYADGHGRRRCGGAVLPASGHHQPHRDRAHRVNISGGLGGYWGEGAAVWCGDWRGVGIADVVVVHRWIGAQHQPWIL